MPRTQEQKDEHADVCVSKLAITFPMLVDGMDARVERDYAGWPDRLYLINTDGRVVYKSSHGAPGFNPSELEVAIQRTVGR